MIPVLLIDLISDWRKEIVNDFITQRKDKLRQFKELISKKESTKPIDIPEGLFLKCEGCGEVIYEKELELNHNVCPICDYHFRIDANKRIKLITDKNTFKPYFNDISSLNPLAMPDYNQKLEVAKTNTKLNEAFVCGIAHIEGNPCAIGVLDSSFIMGSMGSAVGEKVTRLIELSIDKKLPLVIFTASGGARMQEGILSLLQMAKTSGALFYHNKQGLLYISVLTNPTTGGVAASFASLGDINIAEKSSLIGFAGPRVIKQTINQDLPPHFQTAEFQLDKGQVDLVVKRTDLKQTIGSLLKMHRGHSHA